MGAVTRFILNRSLGDEPRFQVLLETTAEVLAGLKTAYAHYDRGEEKARRR